MVALVLIVLTVVMSAIAAYQGDARKRENANAEAARVASLSPEQRAAEAAQKARDATISQATLDASKKWQKKVTAASARAAVAAAMIRNSLRDPHSFELSDVSRAAGGAICITYRARNGFGGMNIEHALVPANGKSVRTSSATDDSEFVSRWNASCKAVEDITAETRSMLKP